MAGTGTWRDGAHATGIASELASRAAASSRSTCAAQILSLVTFSSASRTSSATKRISVELGSPGADENHDIDSSLSSLGCSFEPARAQRSTRESAAVSGEITVRTRISSGRA
eukprot:4330010-Prymnesium_polylepis.1